MQLGAMLDTPMFDNPMFDAEPVTGDPSLEGPPRAGAPARAAAAAGVGDAPLTAAIEQPAEVAVDSPGSMDSFVLAEAFAVANSLGPAPSQKVRVYPGTNIL